MQTLNLIEAWAPMMGHADAGGYFLATWTSRVPSRCGPGWGAVIQTPRTWNPPLSTRLWDGNGGKMAEKWWNYHEMNQRCWVYHPPTEHDNSNFDFSSHFISSKLPLVPLIINASENKHRSSTNFSPSRLKSSFFSRTKCGAVSHVIDTWETLRPPENHWKPRGGPRGQGIDARCLKCLSCNWRSIETDWNML